MNLYRHMTVKGQPLFDCESGRGTVMSNNPLKWFDIHREQRSACLDVERRTHIQIRALIYLKSLRQRDLVCEKLETTSDDAVCP